MWAATASDAHSTDAAQVQRSCPLALASLRKRHTDLEIRLLEREPLQAVALVANREIDLAFTLAHAGVPRPLLPAGVVGTSLRNECMLVADPAWHPLGQRRRLRFADVDLPWIDNRDWGPSLRLLATLAIRDGVAARCVFESDDYQVIMALVEAGFGAALV